MGLFTKKTRSITEIRSEIRSLNQELRDLGESPKPIKEVEKKITPAEIIKDVEKQKSPSNALFNTLSHELRTPLNGVLGMAELLKDKVDCPELETLESCAQHMQSVLHTLVNLFKIQKNWGKLPEHREWINLHDFFEQLKKHNSRRALSRHLVININHQDNKTRLRCDYDHLIHIIETALLASIECTEADPNAPTEILNITWKVEDGNVSIVIENPLERAPENRGQQISQVNDIESALAPERIRMEFLYWSVSISLLEHYDGGMVTGKIEGGNGVRAILGFKMEAMVASESNSRPIGGLSLDIAGKGNRSPEALSFTMDILVCEDDPINQDMMGRLLKRIGQKADIAKNGQDALDLLYSGKHYDLILMDIDMPVLDGISTAQAIRMGEAGNAAMNIPIVAVTAFNTLSDKGKFKKAGMEYYLSKPISLRELRSIILDISQKADSPNKRKTLDYSY